MQITRTKAAPPETLPFESVRQVMIAQSHLDGHHWPEDDARKKRNGVVRALAAFFRRMRGAER